MEYKKEEIISEYRRKLMILVFIGIMVLASYLFIKYMLPVLWPFVIGMILALIFGPVINLLNRCLHINKMIGTMVVLIAVSAIILFISGMLARGVVSQITALMENMDKYMDTADVYICDMCDTIGDMTGVKSEALFNNVMKNIDNFMSELSGKITSFIMGTGIPAIMAFMELVIGIALVVVSLFLFVKDMDGIKRYLKGFYFHKEISFVAKRVFSVTRAYIKAQIIIMSIVAAECVAGLMIMGNKYALLLGILIGILDALPLFGVGTVLLPWTVIYIAAGNFMQGAVIFTVFIVCYFTREFLEPKLIGNKIGINPLVTLVIIYAGFKFLGFTGMFLAPLVFIVVRDSTEIFIRVSGNKKGDKAQI